jgi:dTDP-4-amino-4,6-dideoxygalactose transaminase
MLQDRGVMLPLHHELTETDQDRVVDSLFRAVDQATAAAVA